MSLQLRQLAHRPPADQTLVREYIKHKLAAWRAKADRRPRAPGTPGDRPADRRPADRRVRRPGPGHSASHDPGRPSRACSCRPGRRRRRGRPAPVAALAHGPRPAAGGRGSAWRPRLSAHLRDLARGRRRPGPGHRRTDGARGHRPGRPAARQCHGAHYRHTTPEMAAHIATAIKQPLRLVLEVAEQVLEAHPTAQRAEIVLAATARAFWQISGRWRSMRREKM